MDFSGPFIALLGRNGAGKTTILRAIDWLAENIRTGRSLLQPTTLEAMDLRLDFSVDEKDFVYTINVDPRDDLINETLDFESSKIIVRDGDIGTIIETNEKFGFGHSSVLTNLDSILPHKHEARKWLEPTLRFLRGISYYRFEESPDKFIISDKEYESWSKSSSILQAPDSFPFSLIDLFIKSESQFEEIKAILGPDSLDLIQTLSIAQLETHPENPEESTRYYYPRFQPSESIGGSQRTLTFEDLSAGTQRIVRIVTSIIAEDRSVMLIERPEEQLHSALVRKLIGVMRTYKSDVGSQIIFTTHSSDVLDVLEPEEVRIVAAKEGNTIVSPLSEEDREHARKFMRSEGSLSDFIRTLEDES